MWALSEVSVFPVPLDRYQRLRWTPRPRGLPGRKKSCVECDAEALSSVAIVITLVSKMGPSAIRSLTRSMNRGLGVAEEGEHARRGPGM
jgi:hypothetical protein